MAFSKVHPTCHNIVNGIKPGSNSKKTDKHAADCSKAVCWGCMLSILKIYEQDISCSAELSMKNVL